MAKSERKPPRNAAKRRRAVVVAPSRESAAAEAVTVAWTVSVTMVSACDLAAVAAHWYLLQHPTIRGAAIFSNLMLFGGGVIGVASLALLRPVYRLRRVPPPPGFTVFAVCAAAAPLLAIGARAMQ
ncbi:MAG TPA: hypothetical protein VEQ85_16645 [Lacipirellulaceae bacterium]|nr:hypothetical protein [Lacipirellulaceae bacterium]